MSDDKFWSNRVREGAGLSTVDRISEVLFGLIMVLTFTGTISVAQSDRKEIRELLWSALGCNVAWGIVDALMYWMNIILSRAHAISAVKRFMATHDIKAAREILKKEMTPLVSSLLNDEDLDKMGKQLRQMKPPSNIHLLSRLDFVAGVEIFLLVFLCTLPVAIPFALVKDTQLAMRVSNGVALLLLFAGGFRLAQYSGLRPWVTAIAYTLIGLAMVSLTMALGG